METILNNCPVTNVYPDEMENALKPNHLLFGRPLTSISDRNTQIQFRAQNITAQGKKVNRMINHFWDRWRKEYVVNLRETHKQNLQNQHQQHIRLNDTALIHEKNVPRLTWRKGIVVELLKGHDGKIIFEMSNYEAVSDRIFPMSIGQECWWECERECGTTKTKCSNCWGNT